MKMLKHSTASIPRRAILALLTAVSFALPAVSREAPPLKANLKREGSSYVIEIVNVSSQPVSLTPLKLGGADFSGLSLYLYDPSNGALGEAMGTVFPGPPGPRPQRFEVVPRRSLVASFDREEIVKYLAPLPKCYYLVAIYHEMQRGKRVWSTPSNTIYECSSG